MCSLPQRAGNERGEDWGGGVPTVFVPGVFAGGGEVGKGEVWDSSPRYFACFVFCFVVVIFSRSVGRGNGLEEAGVYSFLGLLGGERGERRRRDV